jgi:glycosyltransferase involved in cell wall biosynthesis
MHKLKIAQVAPLYESVPPKLYGGTERVVSFLTEELVSRGHEVTLFASGDSVTRAKLISPCEKSLRLNQDCIDQMAHHVVLLQLVQDEISNFDIVHYHIDYLHFPLSRFSAVSHLSTLHGRLNIPDLKRLYEMYNDVPVVSISDSQRNPLPHINWVGTVYHGLPEGLLQANYDQGKYLAFLGRISPEKGVDKAIEIAIKCGIPLKVAAKVDKNDDEYYRNHVYRLFDHPLVEYVGEVGEADKTKFLGDAIALLFPINWPEPFGLVMVEAMACGTPVIAFSDGSVPEIVDHGRTGFIVGNVHQAVRAIQNISLIDRRECRAVFEERFSAGRMANDYEKVYNELVESKRNNFDLKIMQL